MENDTDEVAFLKIIVSLSAVRYNFKWDHFLHEGSVNPVERGLPIAHMAIKMGVATTSYHRLLKERRVQNFMDKKSLVELLAVCHAALRCFPRGGEST